jgi:esterase
LSISLNHKIIGQGQPIVILHGLFGTLDNWATFAKKFEDRGFMSILIDQRDHGRSPHTDHFDYPTLAEDLNDFLSDNWIHQTILIGHSMGGKTGLQFVSQYPSNVTKFVCIDIGTKQYQGGHQDIFEALFAVPLDSIQSRDEAQDILMQHIHDLGTVQFLMKNLSRRKEGGFEWKMNLDLLNRDYQNILAEVKFDSPCDVETLFIRGANSSYILNEDIPKLQSIFTNSRIVTIPDAGHWIHVDKPNELFDEIIAFIQQ